MTDNFNKPKNMTDLGVSFEERLEQLGKLSKQSRETNLSSSHRSQMATNHNRGVGQSFNSDSRGMSSRSKQALEEYKERGQSNQILKVWFMLMQAFDSKMKHFFGEEPDVHFMKFAVALTPESYKRLEANLLERLDEDREWPPSLIRLRQLANSPTKEVMYIARQNLFHNPVPSSELGRVELFIRKYKMRELKNFSERNFESEFNRKYTQWFREVLLDDMDIKFDEQQSEMKRFLDVEYATEHDKQREANIAQGKAFDNKFGQKILEAMREKKSQVEEVGPEEVQNIEQLRKEQQRLAARIRKDIGED
ncbi:hypothetical protein DZ860_00225 [Vibrio sinensis]|uniref:Uncharacterized protein n=1 Tax=Vibrio sinensis TaxID=2302434 RepID=A0A3A6QQH0_9VIBR|nr:hypothetical protein [Vibrio sinensis]RJX75150.1 hypothetical protein DZ860_00225 [Vibrio sinensis]